MPCAPTVRLTTSPRCSSPPAPSPPTPAPPEAVPHARRRRAGPATGLRAHPELGHAPDHLRQDHLVPAGAVGPAARVRMILQPFRPLHRYVRFGPVALSTEQW